MRRVRAGWERKRGAAAHLRHRGVLKVGRNAPVELVHGGRELNGAHDDESRVGGERGADTALELRRARRRGERPLRGPVSRATDVVDVDGNVYEYIEHFEGGDVDGDEAGVAVVHHEVGAKRLGAVVVDAASPVGDLPGENVARVRTRPASRVRGRGLGHGPRGTHIAHDDRLRPREVLHDVGNDAGVHEEALWKLQGHSLGLGLAGKGVGLGLGRAHGTRAPHLPDSPHRLVHLKVVVAGKLCQAPAV